MKAVSSSTRRISRFWFIFLFMIVVNNASVFAAESDCQGIEASDSDLDTGGNGKSDKVGSLYWAGSTSRTGLLFYIVITVNNEQRILGYNDFGAGGNPTGAGFILLNSDLSEEYEKVNTHNVYSTHFGDNITASTLVYEDMPNPVQWIAEENRWNSNAEEVKSWLLSEIDGKKRWEYIVLDGFNQLGGNAGTEAIKKLQNANIEYSLILEPIGFQAAYSYETWDTLDLNLFIDDINKEGSTHPDYDYLDYLSKYKEQHGSYDGVYKPVMANNKIVRLCTTGMTAAQVNSDYTLKYHDVSTEKEGGANWKWTNQALPYCMTTKEKHFNISPIHDTFAQRLSASEYNKKDMGYALGIFTDEISLDYIHSYNIDKNPDYPDKAEEPEDTSEKDTTGTHTIIKIYYNQVYDSETTYTYDYVSTHTQPNTTGNISIISEYEETGYALKKWAVTSNQRQLKSYESWDSTFSTANPKQNSPVFTDLQLAEDGNQQYLYILYSKVIPYTPPQVEPEDYEIPESYLTRQVYFSGAKNTSNTENTALGFSKKQFTWSAEAHATCTGHKILTCTKAIHNCKIETTTESKEIKTCTKTEHTHSGDCYKNEFICNFCKQKADTKKAIKHNTGCLYYSNPNFNGYSTNVVACNPSKSNKTTVYACNKCFKILTTEPSKSIHTGCGGEYKKYKIYKCATSQHTCNSNCYKTETTTTYKCTVSGYEVDNANAKCSKYHPEHTDSCYNTVYCSRDWYNGNKTATLGVKVTIDSTYNNIVIPSTSITFLASSEKRPISTIISSFAKQFTTTRSSFAGVSVSKQFDNSFIILRGDDKVTLAKWKATEDQIKAVNSLIGLTDKFAVGNQPVGGRAVSTYRKSFAAKVISNSTDEATTIAFAKASGYDYTKCNNNTSIYKLSTSYNIPKITVKVNVFSDYVKTNSDASTSITGVKSGSISFYPYVRMYYDDKSGLNKSVFVLGETMRSVQFYDDATISYSNKTGKITLDSTQWSTHTSAASALSNSAPSADTSKILPGGATYSLTISKNQTQTVTVTTYQVMLDPNSDGYKQVKTTTGATDAEIKSKIQTSKDSIKSKHESFANSVRNQFEGIKLVQYANTNVKADPFSGDRVGAGVKFNGKTLNSDSKYYFSNYIGSKLQTTNLSATSATTYTVSTDTNGNIKVNGKVVLTKGQTPSALSGNAKTLDSHTGVITSLYNALLTNAGKVGRDGVEDKWYNEAFDGITVVVCSSTFQVGLFNPNSIQSILDPKLIPEQSTGTNNGLDGQSIFTNFYSSGFISMKDRGNKISAIFTGFSSSKTVTKSLTTLYKSDTFYIPNVTTQDLN